MKRKIALLLATALILSNVSGAYAAEFSPVNENIQGIIEETSPIEDTVETSKMLDSLVSDDDIDIPSENTSAANEDESLSPNTEPTDEDESLEPTNENESISPSTEPADEDESISQISNSENENESTFAESGDEDESTSTESDDTDESTNEDEILENIGQIDVSIASALILDRSVTFQVTLTDAQGNSKSDDITLGGSSAENILSFTELADGTYTLTITGAGFADYTQTINVAQKGYLVRLTTGFLAGYPYVAGGLHPGVLLIGDVDNDGDVDEMDKNALIDAIDSGVIPANYVADLNGDGDVNLVDLEFLSKSYGEIGDTTASIEEFISPATIHVSAVEGTTITGDLNNLFNNEEIAALTPSNGEEISAENPVALEFDFIQTTGQANITDGIIIKAEDDNPIAQAVIDIIYEENGEEHTVTVPVTYNVYYLLTESNVYATQDEDGTIQVHLGSQIAVKKVTLTITAMQNNNNLAEISKVEFVNGMEERIPEPEMDIPENLTVTAGSKEFTLTWDPCVNITGYEVRIQQGTQESTVLVASNSLTVTSFNGGSIKNYTTYTVSVQSVNGTWASGYCDSVDVTPKPSGPPDKPDNVAATGKYQSIVVSWKNMDDTQSYNLFYKVRNSEDEYTKLTGITANSYTITGLEELVEYEIYVTGVNEFGESPESLHCTATTTDLSLTVVPKYGLINYTEEEGTVSEHIISATITGSMLMQNSPLDPTNGTAWGTVDSDPASYYYKNTWDDGGFNSLGSNGITYEFDQAYLMDTIIVVPPENYGYFYYRIAWWDENGTRTEVARQTVTATYDAQGKPYYQLKLPQASNVKKIQIGLGQYSTTTRTAIAEVYFYHYDTLMDEVMSLYEDDLHTILKESTTQEVIDALRVKVQLPDEISGETHPNLTALLTELNTAEKILNDGKVQNAKTVEVRTEINTAEVNRGFSGLNAWQPLGVVAAAGEQITIYVGSNTQKTGTQTNIRLYITQYHSESNSVTLGYYSNLKVGANTYTMPKSSLAGQEGGGALYVEYRGSTTTTRYAVRVSGGVQVPLLDLYNVTDETERLEKTIAYVEALDEHVAQIETLHNELHKGSGNSNVDYDYDHQNCILGATDIMLHTMMISVPAQQILAGLGSGSVETRAQKLLNSMDAMDDMMYLFYQHKGLNNSASTALNQVPKCHLNIRYQRMFSGAFMYASGNHIGIEWNETASMATAVPIVSDENGKYISGNYFGWGIAHEIGHCINQSSYAVAEITNNYFSVLAQAQDTNGSVRFDYNNVFDKVTSGTKGNASNVFTQLGMYWQLHLAYDTGYNYKTYSNYSEQLANLFYARVDTYARSTASAPSPNGIALTLGSDTDQNLMRLACAAAEKNILDFFERWGKTPDATTIAYAEQFEKETRAIYYANDDSRVYALEGSGSSLSEDGTTQAIADVTMTVSPTAANQVNFSFSSTNIPASDLLGYEIVRCTTSGGQVERAVVGFTTNDTFTDTITTINNRTVFYEITLIDQYLNRSAIMTTKTIKIEHDGSLDKTNWSITASGLTAEADVQDATDDMPCEQIVENPAEKAIDYDSNTIYAPTVDNAAAQLVIDFKQTLVVTGLKYTAGDGTPISDYEVQVCVNDEWITVAQGSFNGSKTIYFANADEAYVSTYAATAVKLILPNQTGQTLSIAELDVLGVTGDNVDFRRTEDDTATAVIGILSEDYQYAENPDDIIPAGSLIFTGSYKGNPAYNVVLLYDQNGNIVGGIDQDGNLQAQQIILADVPEQGNIANVSNGTWIYWIEPEQMEGMNMPEQVRAELYRVNNALTNEGQRLVSDSLFETLPDSLPNISLNGN